MHTSLLVVLTLLLLYTALVALLESFMDAHAVTQVRMRSLFKQSKSRRADRARRHGDFLRAVLFVIIAIELWI